MVGRHVDLVYSAALRLVGGDAHLAQDVAQGVFTALARRAARLARHASIVGWLYTTTRYTAGNLRRGQHRRLAREQEAYAMNQPTHSSEINWDALQPVLDEAVCALAAADREAVLLRFFQNKSHREVGDALGVGEEAARKRVDRALEKLRAHFARRGVAVSAGVLAGEIGANSVQAAPVGLAATISGGAMVGVENAGLFGILLKALSMTTKTKIATAALIMVIALLGWKFFPTGISKPAKVQPKPLLLQSATTAKIAPPNAVEAPKLAAAPIQTAEKPAQPTTQPIDANSGKEINTLITNTIDLVQADDLETVFETLSSPDSFDNMTPGGKASIEAALPLHKGTGETQIWIQVLRAMQNQTPVYNADGDRATYKISDPTGRGVIIPFPVILRKVGDQWYFSATDILRGAIGFGLAQDPPVGL